MRANGVALGGMSDGANDGAADHGIGMSPTDGYRVGPKGIGMRGEGDECLIGCRCDFGYGDPIIWMIVDDVVLCIMDIWVNVCTYVYI